MDISDEKRKIYEYNDETYKYIEDALIYDLKLAIKKYMNLYKYENIIILCIGTNKCPGDSLGPIIGTKLNEIKLPKNVSCFGTIKKNLNAVTLPSFIEHNDLEMVENLVIAIDCTFTRLASIGSIIVNEGELLPGKGVGKVLPSIGDFHICGVCSNATYSKVAATIDLLTMDKRTIVQMSDMIVESLSTVLFMLFDNEKEIYNEDGTVNYNYYKTKIKKKFLNKRKNN